MKNKRIILDIIEKRKSDGKKSCENCDKKIKGLYYGCTDGILVVELQLCPKCFNQSIIKS